MEEHSSGEGEHSLGEGEHSLGEEGHSSGEGEQDSPWGREWERAPDDGRRLQLESGGQHCPARFLRRRPILSSCKRETACPADPQQSFRSRFEW